MLATPALPDGSTFSNNFATKTGTSRENLLTSAEGGNLVSTVSGQTGSSSASGATGGSSSYNTSETGTVETETPDSGSGGLSSGEIGAIAGSLGGLVAAGVGVAGYVAFKRQAENKLAKSALATPTLPAPPKKITAPFRAIKEKASALRNKVAQWNAERKANKALLAQLTPPPASGTSMTAKVKSFLSSAGSFFSRKKTSTPTSSDVLTVDEHNAGTFLQTRLSFLKQRNAARATTAAAQVPGVEVVPDVTAPAKVKKAPKEKPSAEEIEAAKEKAKTRKAQAKAVEALSPADETALATGRARMFGHDDEFADDSPSGGDAAVVRAPVTIAPDHAVVAADGEAADGEAADRDTTRTAGDKKPTGDEPVAADSSPRIVVSGLHTDPVPTAEDEAARLAARDEKKAAKRAGAADQPPGVTEEDDGLATRRAKGNALFAQRYAAAHAKDPVDSQPPKGTTRPQLIGASGAATTIQRFMRAKIAKKPTVAAPPQEDSVIVVSGEGKKIVGVSGDAFARSTAPLSSKQLAQQAAFEARMKAASKPKTAEERAAAEEARRKAEAERAAEKQAREKARAERREKIAAQYKAQKEAVRTAKSAVLADLTAKFASKETPAPERDAGDVAPRADAPVDAPTTDGRAIPRVELAPLRPLHPTTPDEVKTDAELLVARTTVVDRAPSPKPEIDSPLQTSRGKQAPKGKIASGKRVGKRAQGDTMPPAGDTEPVLNPTPKDKVTSRVGQPKPLTTRPTPGVISLAQGGIALPPSVHPRGNQKPSGHKERSGMERLAPRGHP